MTGQRMGTSRELHDALSTKTPPVDADELVVLDSAASYVRKRLTWANLKAAIQAFYDTAVSKLTNKDLTSGTNTFPTFNQNTTGSAAKWTTARNVDGQSLDGTANITVIAPGTHAATSKNAPVDADEIPLVDSAASNVLKKLTWANLNAAIATLTNKSIDLATNTLTGTKAQFQTACTDDDFLTLAGSQTVTGAKTFSTAPVLNALPTGTAVAAAGTASTLVARDSGAGVTAFNYTFTMATVVTSGGSTTLSTSAGVVRCTGTSTHTIVLLTSFIPTGFPLMIINDSTQTVTVNASGGGLVQSLAAGSTLQLMCITATPTTAAHWKVVNVYP